MRAAAAVHDDHAAAFEDFRARCQGWLETVEEDIVGCQGPVAAPVAAALAAFGERLGQQVVTASAQHGAMGQKLVAAAAGSEAADTHGAAGITAVVV
jgi:hypothetical protein